MLVEEVEAHLNLDVREALNILTSLWDDICLETEPRKQVCCEVPQHNLKLALQAKIEDSRARETKAQFQLCLRLSSDHFGGYQHLLIRYSLAS